ncbi:hypothetical protein EU508_01555 [Pseudoalteromonas fuliginea]|uniref:Uncharacterized protein n=1 Tax=Pseudoalteromonas fuliginea TaxID=1872678 RepID=A0AB73BLG6_9GAMM|nr:hypothetical protein EU508_01555 [Pseudoalteromonas fuliginea]
MEAKVAQEAVILTNAQVSALEKKKSSDNTCDKIETAPPDYLGSQDTFYVGNLKELGTFTHKPLSIPTIKQRSHSSI